MFYLLDGRLCQGIALDPFDEKGRPTRLIYAYDSPEGNEPIAEVWRKTNSIAWVEADDDGATWTAATAPRGANLAVEVHGHVDLGQLYSRLVRLHGVRERLHAANQGGATHGEGTYDPSTVFAQKPPEPDADTTAPLPQLDPADTDQDGTVTKQERKQFERENG